MRAYPCSKCLKSMIEAGVTPYARTGTTIFGKTHSGGGADPVTTKLNGQTIGGLQGKKNLNVRKPILGNNTDSLTASQGKPFIA